jgi:hypothetical protein
MRINEGEEKMDYKKLLEAVLTPLIAFFLKWLLSLINFPIDEATLNALTAAIVAFLLAQVFSAPVARALRLM